MFLCWQDFSLTPQRSSELLESELTSFGPQVPHMKSYSVVGGFVAPQATKSLHTAGALHFPPKWSLLRPARLVVAMK